MKKQSLPKAELKPGVIEPERKPVVWKPWPDEKPTMRAMRDDAPYCPEVGTFYHIVNHVK